MAVVHGMADLLSSFRSALFCTTLSRCFANMSWLFRRAKTAQWALLVCNREPRTFRPKKTTPVGSKVRCVTVSSNLVRPT